MKIFLLSFLFLFWLPNCFGQKVDANLKLSWIDFKTVLELRATKVLDFTHEIVKQKVTKKVDFMKVNATAKELLVFLNNSKKLDNTTIKTLHKKNNNLDNAIPKLMVAIEAEGKREIIKKALNFIAEIEGIENRIALAKRIYNNSCKENERLDLIYPSNNVDKEIKVQF